MSNENTVEHHIESQLHGEVAFNLLIKAGFNIDVEKDTIEETATDYLANYPYLVIRLDTRSVGGNRTPTYTKVTLDELVKRVSVGARVRLNPEHVALISEEGIRVGCQSIGYEAFDQLVAAVKKVRNNSKQNKQ